MRKGHSQALPLFSRRQQQTYCHCKLWCDSIQAIYSPVTLVSGRRVSMKSTRSKNSFRNFTNSSLRALVFSFSQAIARSIMSRRSFHLGHQVNSFPPSSQSHTLSNKQMLGADANSPFLKNNVLGISHPEFRTYHSASWHILPTLRRGSFRRLWTPCGLATWRRP